MNMYMAGTQELYIYMDFSFDYVKKNFNKENPPIPLYGARYDDDDDYE